MKLNNLWKDLPISKLNSKRIVKAYNAGLVPELPYFIVGQHNVKNEVEKRLERLDEQNFDRLILTSNYGNGKTNLFKYLKLYFKTHSNANNFNINFEYITADIDLPNISSMLLNVLDDRHYEKIIEAIENFDETETDILYEQFEDIPKYIKQIFKYKNSKQKLNELVQMGTGRLYYKSYFNNYNLKPFTNHALTQILALFLNLLYENQELFIFAIDEIEKIYDKSKTRLRNFLTSYRELIDISNKIDGHLLLTAMTAGDKQADNILNENPAFRSRIDKDRIEIKPINESNIEELVRKIISLLENNEIPINTTAEKVTSRVKSARQAGLIEETNRALVQEIMEILQNNEDYESIEKIITNFEIEEYVEEKESQLEFDDLFKNMYANIFAPLTAYITSTYENIEVNKQNRRLISKDKDIYLFFENTSFENQINNCKKSIQNGKDVTLLIPKEIDFSLTDNFGNDNKITDKIELITYNPKKLFTLLELYIDSDYFEIEEEISKVLLKFFDGVL
ncbi:MAG: BREX system ATP-binding domain-containing protein [Halarcobacter sp.]